MTLNDPTPPQGTVYQITCLPSQQIYVGVTMQVAARWKQHRTDLDKGRHGNPRLQAEWSTHGSAAFVFEILEQGIAAEDCRARENVWITQRQAEGRCLYNRPVPSTYVPRKKPEPKPLRPSVAPPTLFPADLIQWRHRLDLTQAQLADKLGVAPTTIARWERAESPIPAMLWLALERLEQGAASSA